jgi:hypothetical protein
MLHINRLLLFVCLLLLCCASQLTAGQSVTVETSEPRRIVAVLEQYALLDTIVVINDETYTVLHIPGGGSTQIPGAPQIPILGETIAIPPGTRPVLTVLEDDYFDLPDQLMIPAPVYRNTAGDEETPVFEPDAAQYASANWLPAQPALLGAKATLRGQAVQQVSVYPVRYHPATRTVRISRRLRFEIRFEDAPGEAAVSAAIPAHPDAHFFDGILNKSHMEQWSSRRLLKPARPLAGQMDMQAYTLRIGVEKDGSYLLTRTMLGQNGVPVESLDPRTFKMAVGGKEVALVVTGESDGRFDPGDAVLFYGEQLHGDDGRWNHTFAKENAYLLGWGGAAGQRFTEQNGAPAGAPLADYYQESVHLESELLFYDGYLIEDTRSSSYNRDEGWYWGKVIAGNEFSVTPFVRNLAETANDATIRFRLLGFASTTGLPHELVVTLNSDSLYQTTGQWKGPIPFEASVTFPNNRWQDAGLNTLTFNNVLPFGTIDGWYLDWVEIDSWKQYNAYLDKLSFGSAHNNGRRFQLSGFTSSDVEIWDVTNGIRFTDPAMTSAGFWWQAEFEDSRPADSTRQYVAVATAGYQTPSSIRTLSYEPDLLSSGNRADYLLITHRNFLEPARRLADMRQTALPDGVALVTVQQIYDTFNHGIEEPVAIKTFVRTALQSWSGPPSYLTLFGDASWNYHDVDVRFDRENQTLYTNYVPSYGFPPSDNYYASLSDSLPRLPDIHVGRIPVNSAEQAHEYINKLIEYEQAPNAVWQKDMLLLSGGLYPNERRSIQLKTLKLSMMAQAPPTGMQVMTVEKVVDSPVDYSHKEEIQESINAGVSWLNMIGHASTQLHDLEFGNADELQNTGQYPFMAVLSCQTGRFASPTTVSRGEDFLLTPRLGTVAYFASTGWSYLDENFFISDEYYVQVFGDTVRTLAVAASTVKRKLWQNYILTWGVDLNRVQDMIDQYTFLGEPLIQYAVPATPDLHIPESGVSLSVPAPSEADGTVEVLLQVYNLGLLPTDSVTIRIVDELPDGSEMIIGSPVTIMPNQTALAVTIPWDISTAGGIHQLRVDVDPDNRIAEESEMNNSVRLPVTVLRSRFAMLSPMYLSEEPSGTVTLAAFSPAEPGISGLSATFEVDTSAAFETPLISRASLPVGSGGVQTTIEGLIDGQRYFWRGRIFDGGNYGPWKTSEFQVRTRTSGDAVLSQSGLQFTDAQLTHVAASNAGAETQPVSVMVQAVSAGIGAGSVSNISVDDQPVTVVPNDTTMPDEVLYWGFRVVRLDPLTSQPVDARFFRTHLSEAESEAFAAYVQALPDGAPVVVAVQHDAVHNLTASARDALRQLGAIEADNLSFADSYVLMGRKGAPAGSVPEKLEPNGGELVIIEEPFLGPYPTATVLSPEFSAVRRWTLLDVESSGAPNDIRVDVEGAEVDNDSWTILQTVTFNAAEGTLELPLDIDGAQWPRLRLRADIDNQAGGPTIIERWSLTYQPTVELSISNGSVSLGVDSVFAADAIPLYVTVYNSSVVASDSVRVSVYRNDFESEIITSQVMAGIPADSSVLTTIIVPPTGMSGDVTLKIQVDPDHILRETTRDNNHAYLQYAVADDQLGPRIEVLFDGRGILPGDYVLTEPEIRMFVRDNSQVSISDTGDVQVILNGQRMAYGNNSALEFVPMTGENDLRAEVLFRPTLPSGDHILQVQATDRGGNTAQYEVQVRTEENLTLRDVYNFPNPFPKSTDILYYLTQDADDVSAHIYTVAGRKIRELRNMPNLTGFNKFEWDGRDADGDRPASGAYLCRIIARNAEDETAVTLKMVLMRQ